MKYVIIHGDGMADWPCDELGGQTPLEAARKPNMDLLATRGTLGMVATIPKGMPSGSDVGTMTMLGYDPARFHTGRAPIEAASQGIEMAPDDIIFRMNLVSVGPGDGGPRTMNDFTSGHISSEEAAQIVADINRELGGALRSRDLQRGNQHRAPRRRERLRFRLDNRAPLHAVHDGDESSAVPDLRCGHHEKR
jgi:2,3-bisphosphoglycerate-independent phosphoglycerate mutase